MGSRTTTVAKRNVVLKLQLVMRVSLQKEYGQREGEKKKSEQKRDKSVLRISKYVAQNGRQVRRRRKLRCREVRLLGTYRTFNNLVKTEVRFGAGRSIVLCRMFDSIRMNQRNWRRRIAQASRIRRVHVYGSGAVRKPVLMDSARHSRRRFLVPLRVLSSTTRSIPGHDCDTEDAHGRCLPPFWKAI